MLSENVAKTAPRHQRFEYVDGARGYLIFAMTVGHVSAIVQSSTLSFLTHKPWTIFLTGEGFMLLSGFMTGYMICRYMDKESNLSGIGWALSRSLKIILYYFGVLLICAAPMLLFDTQNSFATQLFYDLDILRTDNLILFALGVYRPVFFDILHLYVFYIALAPIFLIILFSRFWWLCVTLCTLLWLLTQYGVILRATQLALDRLPEIQILYMGAFHFFGWQAIFFLGCAIGGLVSRTNTSVRDIAHKTNITFVDIIFALMLGFMSFRALQVFGVFERHATYGSDYLIVAPLPLFHFLLISFVVVFLLSDSSLEKSSFRFVFSALRRALRWFFLLAPLRTIGSVTLQSFSASIVFSYFLAYLINTDVQTGFGQALVCLASVMLGTYMVAVLALAKKKRSKSPRKIG